MAASRVHDANADDFGADVVEEVRLVLVLDRHGKGVQLAARPQRFRQQHPLGTEPVTTPAPAEPIRWTVDAVCNRKCGCYSIGADPEPSVDPGSVVDSDFRGIFGIRGIDSK